MPIEKDTWSDYSKLVLKELERLNENYNDMRTGMDSRFNELNQKLNEAKNVEGKVDTHAKWLEKVNEVWSPSQMKEAKDEIYKQKNRWAAAIAIFTFVQIAIGIVISIWSKLR